MTGLPECNERQRLINSGLNLSFTKSSLNEAFQPRSGLVYVTVALLKAGKFFNSFQTKSEMNERTQTDSQLNAANWRARQASKLALIAGWRNAAQFHQQTKRNQQQKKS